MAGRGPAPPPPPPPTNGRSAPPPPPPPPAASGAAKRPSGINPPPPLLAPTASNVTPPQPPRTAAATIKAATAQDSGELAAEKKQRAWISDDDSVWTQVDLIGELPKEGEASITIRRTKTSPVEEYLLDGEVSLVNPSSASDMTALHYIHEAGILDNLRVRSLGLQGQEQAPYTFMASALIAVNPLKNIPEPSVYAYVDQPVTAVSPHPYSIAELAYKNLQFSRMNQSVIISGESGAGKTETAKIILRFLVERNAQYNSRESIVASTAALSLAEGSLSEEEQLDLKLLRSSPIMESFGNAKTVKNHNSSRFGKLMKLCFTFDDDLESNQRQKPRSGVVKKSKNPLRGQENFAVGGSGGNMTLIGARVETYLLEKNRVMHQAEGECNYHIFYHLLAACEQHPELHLHDAEGAFNILSQSSVHLFENINNKESDLNSIADALRTTGFTTEEVSGIWRILAGLLHLGNVTFEDHETGEGEVARIATQPPAAAAATAGKKSRAAHSLELAATVWGVSQQRLRDTVMSREMFTAGEAYVVPFTAQEASFARDATVKAVYEALFEFVVRRINRSLAGTAVADDSCVSAEEQLADKNFVGVLDIFGFENFQQNGLEQLLINYANEALQNTFNHQLFDKELQLFREENIEFAITDCPSNQECVDLIAGRSNNSVFKIIDAVGRQAKSSDERFCEELHKAFSQHKYFPPIKRRADMRSKFNILHYAGEVTYTVAAAASSSVPIAAGERRGSRKLVPADIDLAEGNTWLSKNRDSVPDSLTELFVTSELPAFTALAGEAQRTPAGGKRAMRRKSVMMKPTISAMFSKSMAELNALLLSTTSQFIRCIKPNASMQPDVFDNQYVVKQIRSLGILQACEVLKVSLPTRVSYKQLKAALPEIVNSVQHLFTDSGESDESVVLIACLLRAFKISPDLYRLGRTMVFFRPGQLAAVQGIMVRSKGDDASPSRDQEIIASIEESFKLNKAALALVASSKDTLGAIQTQFSELDDAYEKLLEKAKDAPEVRDLDLPAELVESISQIESLFNRTQKKQNENNMHLLNLNANLLAREEGDSGPALPAASADYLRSYYKRCEGELNAATAKLFADRAAYSRFNDAIQQLEESTGGLSPNFQDTLDNNDSLYEQLQTQLEEYEEATLCAKDEAERCQLDKVQLSVQRCTNLSALIEKSIVELRAGIDSANREYAAFEASGSNVDFSKVQEQAATVVAELNETQVALAAAAALVLKFEADMQSELANPRQPATTAAATAVAEGGRRDSLLEPPAKPGKAGKINFSIKDLAALKQRKAQLQQQQQPSSTESNAAASAATTNSTTAAAATTNTSTSISSSVGNVAHVSVDGIEVEVPLPEGWRELEDKNSGRKYYVNTVSKERQWKRPLSTNTIASTTAAAATTTTATTSAAAAAVVRSKLPARGRNMAARITSLESKRRGSDNSSASLDAESGLPEGWRSAVDKKTGRTYFVHEVTKKRQWKRPANDSNSDSNTTVNAIPGSPSATAANNNATTATTAAAEDSGVRRSSRLSRRMILKDVHAYLAKEGLSPSALNTNYTTYNRDLAAVESAKLLAQQKIAHYRARSAAILNAPFAALEAVRQAPRSVSQLTRVGKERKVGALMKQGRFLGRWKRRYFVLQNGVLEYYDSARDAEAGHNCKAFVLSGSSMVTYTSTENCLAVSDPQEGDAELHSWYLLANSEKEMEEWMSAINAHIHCAFVSQYQIETDFWEEGTVTTSFWMVPVSAGAARRPVGIRSLPIVDGPRTGEGLYPGEIVEVVQIIEEPATLQSPAQKFLRLADDRGWIFENHPTNNYTLMLEVQGELNEEPFQYQYSADCLDNLEAFACPTCNNPDLKTGLSFLPGQLLSGSAEWTTECPYAFINPAAVFGGESVTFVKLSDHSNNSNSSSNSSGGVISSSSRGWVPMYHPVTGGELLLRIPHGGKPPQQLPLNPAPSAADSL